jgi:putative hydrolase of the HAD superfamily
MKRPKMIIFDYGQTLVAEAEFDGAKGAAAVMAHAVSNPMSLTPEDVQAEANKINKELNRFDRNSRAQNTVEIPNHMFTRYLYDSLGIKIDLTAEEIDRLFWDNASPGRPTNGMPDLLEWLWQNGIRTAVLSNISYAGSIVEERINRLLPDNHFEFIIATSEFLFRKPHARIFELALGKAGLPADDVWYIGDNYACDIVGARTAGLFPVLFTGASDYEQPEHDDVISIASWTELKELISDIQK